MFKALQEEGTSGGRWGEVDELGTVEEVVARACFSETAHQAGNDVVADHVPFPEGRIARKQGDDFGRGRATPLAG